MLARDIMSHPAVTVRADDDLEVAARRMWDHDCGAVVVVNDAGKAVGMLTDRDICMAAFTQGKVLAEVPVHHAMSHYLISVGPEDPIASVEELMEANQVCRIPVVDEVGMVLGLVALNDLAVAYLRIAHQLHAPLDGGPLAIATTVANCSDHRPHRRSVPGLQAGHAIG